MNIPPTTLNLIIPVSSAASPSAIISSEPSDNGTFLLSNFSILT